MKIPKASFTIQTLWYKDEKGNEKFKRASVDIWNVLSKIRTIHVEKQNKALGENEKRGNDEKEKKNKERKG